MEEIMVRTARLDHDQVYWGLSDPKPLAELAAGELVFCAAALKGELPQGARWVDAGCDLAGGQFRWNAAAGCFEPLPRAQRKVAEEAPTLEQAFYAYITGDRTADNPVVEAWVTWYRKTMDAQIKRRGS